MAMTQPTNDDRRLKTIDPATLDISDGFDARKVELIKSRYFVEGAGDEELQLFLTVASRRGLDPTRNHIYAVERYDSQKKRKVISYQVSIDGLRLIAERSGKYEGQTAPQWCGKDAQWRDVWLEHQPPAAARVGVYKRGFQEPVWAVARWDSYAQTTREGQPTRFWKNMPDIMLAKCAESLALRKAFPEESAGLFTSEEMDQADNPTIIDHDTGEITEPRQTRQDRSHEPIEAEVVETPPHAHAGTWEEENRRLHAIAHNAGLDHAKIKVWLIAAALGKGKEITSTKDASPEALRNLGDRIERDAAKVEKQATDALMNPAVYKLYEQGEAEKALGQQVEIDMEGEGEDE